MSSGSLALLLHAHLPYVRHPEHDDFLEEDWLYEAIAETYIPLLSVFERLVNDGIAFQVTMSMTPPLVHMLQDPLLQERAERYLQRSVELAEREMVRTRHEPHLLGLAKFYHYRFSECLRLYTEVWKKDLVGAFSRLQDQGSLEIITCAATHGFLPLMAQFPEAVRAQILLGRDHYRTAFGRDPRGIWLPECAYAPGIDAELQKAGLRWCVLDSHGVMFGNPRPRFAIFAPVWTPAGVAAFPRDRDSSRQVWSAEHGYPGDPAYRDFYKDIGFDLSDEYLRPFLPPDGTRKFTGFKYHRITGRTPHKDHYNRAWAEAAADHHAGDFLNSRMGQIRHLAENMPTPPLVLSPFDAGLFGHWWFEGPEFLDLFLRKASCDQQVFDLTTPSAYLEKHTTLQIVEPCPSSWGHKGYWEVWLDESNSWIYPHLHAAARRMIDLASAQPKKPKPGVERLLRQLGRELLLAQSSDWAFLMKTGTAKEYATKRTKDHLLRFNRLFEQHSNGTLDETFLAQCEQRDNIFPDLEWRYYRNDFQSA